MIITPTLLAIETSTENCSVALLCEGGFYERIQTNPKLHGQMLLPMIDAVLSEAKVSIKALDAIAVGCGPGAFTGLRIGFGVAQGLAFGIQKPIIPISSLRVLAEEAKETVVLAVQDARMGEVYWGIFGENKTPGTVEKLTKPENIHLPLSGTECGVVGGGGDKYFEILKRNHPNQSLLLTPFAFPRAKALATLALAAYREGGCLVQAALAHPVYVRDVL